MRVHKLQVVVIRTQCDMICNKRKHVCVGAGGFANQEGWKDSGNPRGLRDINSALIVNISGDA